MLYIVISKIQAYSDEFWHISQPSKSSNILVIQSRLSNCIRAKKDKILEHTVECISAQTPSFRAYGNRRQTSNPNRFFRNEN